MLIKRVHARKIKDSRGAPTIEVSINRAKASSPSGKSKGVHETPSWYKSIDWNIKFLNNFKPDVSINSFKDLEKLENAIKKETGLKDVKQFGANALFALECAALKALAKSKKKALWQVINGKARKFPIPLGNAVGGGLHSKNKNKPALQEFLIIPKEKSISENVKTMNSVYQSLGKYLSSRRKNDEGAWETSNTTEAIFEFMQDFKDKVRIGTDIAASSFFKKGKYKYDKKSLDRNTQIDYVESLIKHYGIYYVEDPLDEEDFSGFKELLNRNPRTSVLVCGDDLTASQISRLKKAIRKKAINATIVKPNQNGSLLELKKIFDICKKNKIKTILSHRSGETMDDALADLAFGFQADFIKAGISTKWREVKLRRLMQIEKSLG